MKDSEAVLKARLHWVETYQRIGQAVLKVSHFQKDASQVVAALPGR